jgi:hypothetical protein
MWILLSTARLRLACADFRDCFANDIDHYRRRGDDGRVVNRVGAQAGLHALRHEALGLGQDHVVLFGD